MQDYENHQLVFLEEGRNSFAYFSFTPNPKNLIIFVHGFGGKAHKSWGDFHIYIKNYSKFVESDVIFYGYKSMTRPVDSSADLFREHIKKFVNPKKVIGSESRGDSVDHYEQILFVGHSLGAVILRRAILDSKFEKADWIDRAKILLFAPAHKGAYPQMLILDSIPGIFKVVGNLGTYIFSAARDLKPNSTTILELARTNMKYLESDRNDNFTKAKAILNAVNDRVIVRGRFCEDPNPDSIHKKNHVSLCKPVFGSYDNPVELVLKELV